MRSRLRDRSAGLGSALVAALVIIVVLGAPALAEWSTSTTKNQTVTMGTVAAPSGLAAANGACVARTSWFVDLSWTATPTTFADGYEILRSTTAGGPYTPLGTVNGRTTTTFIDTTPTSNTTYFYVVQAKRSLWRSPDSNQATVTTLKMNCN